MVLVRLQEEEVVEDFILVLQCGGTDASANSGSVVRTGSVSAGVGAAATGTGDGDAASASAGSWSYH